MAREKLWHENVNLTLPKGAKDAMDGVLRVGEDRLDMIRDAISREMKRRGHGPLPVKLPPAKRTPRASKP